MIVGTAGHIDHGKTALVKALTGIDADRLQEEKARGITIDLGYAYQALPSGDVLGFVDVPGHEKLIHNMLAGATGIDYVLLVVAADDGPMPQTTEHLQILDLLGLSRGAVALTKCDLVDTARVQHVTDQVRALLATTELAEAPIFPLSSVTGEGIAQLAAHLQTAAAKTAPHAATGHFRLAVDRCFTLAGAGIVVTGTAFSGRVRVSDKLLLSPSGIEVRVRGIHAQNRAAELGVAGQRCALNLAASGLEKDHVHRGDWVLGEALHAPTPRLDCRFRLLAAEAKPLRHWTPVHVHLGTSDVTGRVALIDAAEGDALEPGAAGLVQLVLDKPLGALHGDRFIVRDQSAKHTLGGGMVLDPFPPARGRRRPERLQVLSALGQPHPADALRALLGTSAAGVDLDRFGLSYNLTADDMDELRQQVRMVMPRQQGTAFAPARWQALRTEAGGALARYHEAHPDVPGPTPERLRCDMQDRLTPPVFAALADALLGEGEIVRDGPWLRLPEHEARLLPADEKVWAEIQPLLGRGGYQPPRVRDIAGVLRLDENAVRQLLRRLARLGRVLLVAHDHYFLRPVVAELAAIAQDIARQSPDGRFGAAEFRDRVGTGRKLAIQILEFFDRAGFTLRIGDLRRVRQDCRAVFGEPEGTPPATPLRSTG